MSDAKVIRAVFYRNSKGSEPVREWLKTLPKEEMQRIGEDLKTVEFGWPIGMPTCRPLGSGLWEVRTSLNHRIARILFCIRGEHMIILHGFIKKTQKIDPNDLEIARQRMKEVME